MGLPSDPGPPGSAGAFPVTSAAGSHDGTAMCFASVLNGGPGCAGGSCPFLQSGEERSRTAPIHRQGVEGVSEMVEQPLLRVKEAAQLLQVSKWTIYRWIDEGRLNATKIGGGSLRIFRVSVTALVEGNRTDPRPLEPTPHLKAVPPSGRRAMKR